MRSKSPVSATTVVNFLSCSSWLRFEEVLFMGLLNTLKWVSDEYHMIDGLITQFQSWHKGVQQAYESRSIKANGGRGG